MRHINAVKLRQSLAAIINMLAKNGDPIILDKGKKPVAVLISLKDFQERFVEKAASEARLQLAIEMDALAINAKDATSAEHILRDLRDA